jgi:hypothetical protein
MKKTWILAGIVAAIVPAAQEGLINWKAATIASGGNVNPDDPNNWSTLTVPGLGDDANMAVNGDANWITIPAGALFNPDGYLRYSHGAVNRKLTVLKSLTLSGGLGTDFGTTSGGNASDQVRLGDSSNPITLSLTGNAPFSFANQAGWGSINVVNAIVNLSGANILFPTLGRAGSGAAATGAMLGGTVAANESDTTQPILNFTAAGGTITLGAAGSRPGGTLGLGAVRMGARSDQTWVCDPNGFVLRNYQSGTTALGAFLVKSIDGGALNNLDQVNFVLTGTVTTTTTAATAMQLAGGEYGSLNWNGGSTSFRDTHMKMAGDVAFQGYAVNPGTFGGSDSQASDTYGLIIRGFPSNQGSYKYLLVNGRTLSVAHGMLLDDFKPADDTTTSLPTVRVDANMAAVNVGGDLMVYSTNWGAAARTLDTDGDLIANTATRNMGIDGGYEGVTLTVGGNYGMNTRSLNSGTGWNLSRSTVKMLGGTQARPVTFEVADADGNYTVQKNSFSIQRLDIGAAADAAYVKLANNYLNENARFATIGESEANMRVGEKLIVGTLNVLAASTLDVSGQVMEVGPGGLAISADSWLDLHTGLALVDGSVVTNFYGLGDQAAAWNVFAARVMDTDNSLLAFQASYVAGDGRTYWTATAVPEPGTLALLGIGAAAILLRRRRRA